MERLTMYVRLIVGIALVLIAALGPYFGVGRVVRHQGVDPAAGEVQTASRHTERAHSRAATVLVLRVGAAVLGAILIVLSGAQLLQGHGTLRPQDTRHAVAQ